MDKVFLIFSDLFGQKEIDGVKIISPFWGQNFIVFRFLKKVFVKLGFKSAFINKSQIKKLEGTIIVFDVVPKEFVNWLKKHQKSRRIIFWYWNPVETRKVKPSDIPSSFEKWSYMKSDCQKYGLKWNTTFATPKLMNYKMESLPKYDFVFVGRGKGRIDTINSLADNLKAEGYTCQIIFTKNKTFDPKNSSLHKLLSYEEYLDIENNAKVLIDFGMNKDVGMTLRSLEALYLGKKLLCNYSEVLDSSIPKDRIYMMDDSNKIDPKKLAAFVNQQVSLVNDDVLDYYSFSNWIKRFDF